MQENDIPDDSDSSPESANVNEPTPLPQETATPPELPPYRSFPLSFTGDAGEYFRIWIVNVLLSLVTLGIYIPWAKVRTRRYFHAHTHLDGHSFDYLAKPINIFWGYLIVVVFYIAFNVAGTFNPLLWLPIFFIYMIVGPWLVYKAMRFKARNTSYRNVRFEFRGELGDAYLIFLGMAFLFPLTLGLIFPYWMMKQKEYFYQNLYYGGKKFDFKPDAGEYYVRYIIGGAISIGLYFAFIFLFVGLTASMSLGGGIDPESGEFPVVLGIVMFLAYAVMLIGFSFVQVYIFVSLFNYNLGKLLLERTTFTSELKIGSMYWITITNTVVSVLTLGLMVPWAAIRKTKYVLENISVEHPGETLGEYASGSSSEDNAIGDAAADAFDFDIGW